MSLQLQPCQVRLKTTEFEEVAKKRGKTLRKPSFPHNDRHFLSMSSVRRRAFPIFSVSIACSLHPTHCKHKQQTMQRRESSLYCHAMLRMSLKKQRMKLVGLLILWRQRCESTLNSTTRNFSGSKLAFGDLLVALFCITSYRDSDFGAHLLN